MKGRASEIMVDGVRLAIDRVGRGPTVVCLSAIGHDAADFDPLATRLGDQFEFVRLEWPSHGGSGPDKRPASAARYAQLVDLALETLAIKRPILIGNSIGGAAAILVASQRPLAGLVLCNCGGLVQVNATVRRFTGVFAAFFRAGERRRPWYGPVFALYYCFVLPGRLARGQRRRIVRHAYDTARMAREAWESFGRPDADIRSIAAQVNAPVWVAWAKDDRVIPIALCRTALAAIPNASISLFKGGHSAFLEQPDAFADGFSTFAASVADLTESQAAITPATGGISASPIRRPSRRLGPRSGGESPGSAAER